MGFNTNLTIMNDGFDQLERHPAEFIHAIRTNMQRGGTLTVGNHHNVAHVLPTDHADATQLIAVGGNHTTKLHTAYYLPSHHTKEGQVELLRRWADALGYRISRKPGHNA